MTRCKMRKKFCEIFLIEIINTVEYSIILKKKKKIIIFSKLKNKSFEELEFFFENLKSIRKIVELIDHRFFFIIIKNIIFG